MNIKAFVLHHTATGTGRIEDGSDIVESMRRYANQQSKGRFQHFYHRLIGPKGHIFAPLPWETVAPHCGIDAGDRVQDPSGVTNQNSIAICCIGNFEEHTMPEAQYQALLKICIEGKKLYPHAFFKLHRELVATACPGRYFTHTKLFNDIKREQKTIMDVPSHAWFSKAVHYCLDRNLMQLDENQRFHPHRALTRAEMAQVLFNLRPIPIVRGNGQIPAHHQEF